MIGKGIQQAGIYKYVIQEYDLWFIMKSQLPVRQSYPKFPPVFRVCQFENRMKAYYINDNK